MKIKLCFLLIFFTVTARSQTVKDYVILLTADLRQSWKLDSITFNSNYSDFKKETVFLFKLDNQVILSNSHLQKKDTLTWFLEKKERYTLISLGTIGRYEIDFLQKNDKKYMRLRNEVTAQKNMGITEYFFTKSNL
ncbi:MAG TPA: hypothetical protein VK787_09480 [Puia sp.]|jgi:hypothetical protein|nr:hypothetical protein [Puia sp.]